MKRLRGLALMHPELVPPDDAAERDEKERFEWKTEWDVCRTLREIGHDVRALGVQDELLPIRDVVQEFSPHVVFNLLEEFHGNVLFDQNVVSLLELLRVPYTGCNPRGMIISREKALSKKLLVYHRIRVPAFHVFPAGSAHTRVSFTTGCWPRFVRNITFPLTVAAARSTEASAAKALAMRKRFMKLAPGVCKCSTGVCAFGTSIEVSIS